jgi:hypothetical protein
MKDKYVITTSAARSISVWAIHCKKTGLYAGKILSYHTDSSTIVNVWLEGHDCGMIKGPNDLLPEYCKTMGFGHSSGCGFNRENDALEKAFRQFTKKYPEKFYQDLKSQGPKALCNYDYEVIGLL